VNQVRDFWRTRRNQQAAVGPLPHEVEQLEDPASDASRKWDLEHDQPSLWKSSVERDVL
jgi:hypothetical protein